VHAFFENLLPEGDQRRIVGVRHQVSTVFGLLAATGGDNAGSLVLLPEGQVPQPPVYQPLTWEQVNALLHADGTLAQQREQIEAAAAGMPNPRLSISGTQFKMPLFIDAQCMPLRPMGASPSTHILKPDIVRTDISISASAVNETIVMRAAARCGLPVAEVSCQPVTKACLVRRFDRIARADGSLRRLWQADFCQLLGKPSDVKYEHDGGPSFSDCYRLLQMSATPGVDRRHLLRWLFFNLYMGNNDSHAKNLSLLATPEGTKLAPFYDLMSTRVYSGLGQNFAFAIGGESVPGQIGARQVAALAAEIGVRPRYLAGIARAVAADVADAIPAAAKEIDPLLGPSERILAGRLVERISDLARKASARLLT